MVYMDLKNKNNISVDVLIPVYRPGSSFDTLLKMLSRQTVQPGKIILMITGTQDTLPEDFPEKLPANAEVHFTAKEDFDHGGTRNALVACSDAEYFICMTQDAVPRDELLVENLLAPMKEDERIRECYARQIPDGTADEIERISREFNYPDKSYVKTAADAKRLGIKTCFASNVCAAYDRETFDSLGGFPGRTIFNEDMIYACGLIRAGYAIAYCADAQVYHTHHYTPAENFRRNFDNAASQAEYSELFGDFKCETEGKKLVLFTTRELVKRGKPYLIPELIVQSAAKYLGFRKGLKSSSMTVKQKKRCSMNAAYWDKVV